MVGFFSFLDFCLCSLLGIGRRKKAEGDVVQMNFIKKIFDGNIDDEVHRQFKRFSKGEFQNRAVIEMNVGKELKIKTSFEFTNEFVRFLAGTIKDKVYVSGGIITTKDIRQGLGFDIANIKQFAGVKTFEVGTNIAKGDLIKVMNSFSDAVFCLSFSTEYGSLKAKVKSPKSAKPGKGDGNDVKADHCVFVTKDLEFKKEFAFDIKEEFKKFKVVHDFIISELVVPKEYQNDFEKARIYARRKGKLVRKVEVDGKNFVKEISFEA
ncbi:hypothetical protein J4230_02980 [Candidatus Woesearchaeota archaeon]|nr:hypothetical protein [Candidatus Woesearchaeota archaeon]